MKTIITFFLRISTSIAVMGLVALLAACDQKKEDVAVKASRQASVPAKPAVESSIPVGNVEAERMAAESGGREGQLLMAYRYESGQGVPRDHAKAFGWFLKAAEQGEPRAQYMAGLFYEKGQGVMRDDTQAATWMKKAAEKEHVMAQTNLGLRYAKGQGVPQDYREAMFWLNKAANKWDLEAQKALGNMYATGVGATKDLIMAHYWYKRASHNWYAKEEDAEMLKKIVLEMTPVQIKDAEKKFESNNASSKTKARGKTSIQNLYCQKGLYSLRLPENLSDIKKLGVIEYLKEGRYSDYDSYKAVMTEIKFVQGLHLTLVTFTNNPDKYMLEGVAIEDVRWEKLSPFRVGESVATARQKLKPFSDNDPDLKHEYYGGMEDYGDSLWFQTENGLIKGISYSCYVD